MTGPTQPQPTPQPASPAPAVAPKKSKAPLIIGIVAAVVLVLCGGTVACVAMLSTAVDDAVNNPAQPGVDAPSNADDSDADGDGSGGNDSGGDDSGGDEPAGNAAGGIGDPVRDGKFEFTVTKVECGIERVGNDFLNEDAQGQFCKVYLTVKNIGDEPQLFSDSDQFAFNAAGQKYGADSAAAIYLDEESNAFLENINPGNSVEGIILFDIPKDAEIVRLELHDSFLSGGVTVNL